MVEEPPLRRMIAVLAACTLGVLTLSEPAYALHTCLDAGARAGSSEDRDTTLGVRGNIDVYSLSIHRRNSFLFVVSELDFPFAQNWVSVGWARGDATGGALTYFRASRVDGQTSQITYLSTATIGPHQFYVRVASPGSTTWFQYIDGSSVGYVSTSYNDGRPEAFHSNENRCNQGDGHFYDLRYLTTVRGSQRLLLWSLPLYQVDYPFCLEPITAYEFLTHGPQGHDPQC